MTKALELGAPELGAPELGAPELGAPELGAPRGLPLRFASALLMLAVITAPATAQTVDKGKHMIDGVRDARYCEIIPVVRRGLRVVGTVYNTLGLNDCPPAVWDKITEEAMRKRFRALMVVLNGPRHFVMDAIAAEGDTASGATVDAAGLSLTARATIKLRLADMRTKPYRERTVDRQTRYVYMKNIMRQHAVVEMFGRRRVRQFSKRA